MKIIAHRANGFEYKENTKEAILKCLDTDYIDGIEIDVRMTKDKKIVIIHDSLINFVSDGSGIVSNMNYDELLKYNFGTKENISKIALLDDVLSLINNNKIILIELKEFDEYKEFVDIVYNIISII